MKKLTYLLCLLSITSFAQIRGNKQIETRTFPFNSVNTIIIDLNARIIIDQSLSESLEITAESNMFEHIDKKIIDGTIHFGQLKWIEPTQTIIIKIGALNVNQIVHDTHQITRIININNDKLSVNAAIGKVVLEGKSNTLKLHVENGSIDATELEAKNAYINLLSHGIVKINATNYLEAKVSDDGKLFYTQLPESNTINTSNGGLAIHIDDIDTIKKTDVKWISFKIKNNSLNRNHFVVKGPKQNGGHFGYGFPMMPLSKRQERWTVGTKIYKETKLGVKNLLVTITAEDEGQIVKLFKD